MSERRWKNALPFDREMELDFDLLPETEAFARKFEWHNRRIRRGKFLVLAVSERRRSKRSGREFMQLFLDGELGNAFCGCFDPDLMDRLEGSVGQVVDVCWYRWSGATFIVAIVGRG